MGYLEDGDIQFYLLNKGFNTHFDVKRDIMLKYVLLNKNENILNNYRINLKWIPEGERIEILIWYNASIINILK